MDTQQFESTLKKLNKTTKEKFIDFLRCLDEMYYNTENSIPDIYYDEFRDLYTKRFGIYEFIGAKTDKIEVELPYHMGSMEKIKMNEQKELDKWLEKNSGPFIIEEKLDGVSALLIYDNKGKKSLMSRGSTFGSESKGFNIDNLLPYLKLPNLKNIAVRLELIISKKDFQDLLQSGENLKNARNTVSGIVNAKTLSKRANRTKKITPLAFELIQPTGYKTNEQLNKLNEMGFNTPYNEKKKLNEINTVEKCNDLLNKFRNKSEYEIDGIILYDDSKFHNRNEINTVGNPKYAIAFKNITETTRAKVVQVVWKDSRHRKIKPRVEIEPVHLGGITITYLTGDNAKYILDNNIGPDTIVEITRAGDVIPKILKVIKSTQAQMPNQKYHWTTTNVDIILDEDVDSTESVISIIQHFFSTLKAKGVSTATIKKLVENGYTTIDSILKCSLKELNKYFGPKQSENIHASIHNSVKNVDIALIMSATTTFFGEGMGPKKIQLILDEYPNILNEDYSNNEYRGGALGLL